MTVLRAVLSGYGTTDTLGALGEIKALYGAFGSYSLGMNNIANVVGVFTASSTFVDIKIGDLFVLSSTQQLLFLGGISIALGVISFSKKVIMTVGSSIYKLSPIA